MKKDIKSKDIISEGTLHEILLDIKYRLDHLEDIEADNRALIVKLIKQTNSIVKFLASIDMEPVDDIFGGVELPSMSKSSIEPGKIKDFFLITPFLIALSVGVIMNTLIYLCLSLGAFILFIYKKIKWS